MKQLFIEWSSKQPQEIILQTSMCTEGIIHELREIYPNRFDRLWWIQDGAPTHGSPAVREFLQTLFNDRIVALHYAVEWPPKSPDLKQCDYFLWGYLKSKVYFSPPTNATKWRKRIVKKVNLRKKDEIWSGEWLWNDEKTAYMLRKTWRACIGKLASTCPSTYDCVYVARTSYLLMIFLPIRRKDFSKKGLLHP